MMNTMPITQSNAELWSTSMTKIPMINQDISEPEGSVSDTADEVPLQTLSQFVQIYHSQAHEITEAVTAVVLYAQAGLNWLRAESPDLEKIRLALDGIAGDGKRACEVLVRLRALMEPSTAEGTSDS